MTLDNTIWLFNSLPWKDPSFLIGKPSISMGDLYHGYVKLPEGICRISGSLRPYMKARVFNVNFVFSIKANCQPDFIHERLIEFI